MPRGWMAIVACAAVGVFASPESEAQPNWSPRGLNPGQQVAFTQGVELARANGWLSKGDTVHSGVDNNGNNQAETDVTTGSDVWIDVQSIADFADIEGNPTGDDIVQLAYLIYTLLIHESLHLDEGLIELCEDANRYADSLVELCDSMKDMKASNQPIDHLCEWHDSMLGIVNDFGETHCPRGSWVDVEYCSCCIE